MGCGCGGTVSFIRKLGSEHDNLDESPESLLKHFAEEDRYLKPLIVKHFECLLPVYEADHEKFRLDLRHFGYIADRARFIAHSKMEDWITNQLIKMGY